MTTTRGGGQAPPLKYEVDPAIELQLLEHPGEWAAITPKMVLAVGRSLPKVLKAAARDHPNEKPILYHVPETGSMYFF